MNNRTPTDKYYQHGCAMVDFSGILIDFCPVSAARRESQLARSLHGRDATQGAKRRLIRSGAAP
jgi:hypothetical protein